MGVQFLGACVGALVGLFAGIPNLVGADDGGTAEWGRTIGIGAAIGWGVGAILGFGRGFFAEYPRNRTARAFPVDINLVPVSKNNFGVQMVHRISF